MAAMVAIFDFWSEQFELFFIYKSSRCFLPTQKEKKKIFKMAARAAILDFSSEKF